MALDWQPDRLVVTVMDDGVPDDRSGGREGGRGLLGLAERVALYGGSSPARTPRPGWLRGARGAAPGRCPGPVGTVTVARTRARLRVLVVDDQALVRAGFSSILQREEDLEVVGEAADGVRGARGRRAAVSPDVVLMDVRMPRMDGIAATRQLRARPSGRARRRPHDLRPRRVPAARALRAGACGFLLKDVRAEHLPGAVRAAALRRRAGSAAHPPVGSRRPSSARRESRPYGWANSCPGTRGAEAGRRRDCPMRGDRHRPVPGGGDREDLRQQTAGPLRRARPGGPGHRRLRGRRGLAELGGLEPSDVQTGPLPAWVDEALSACKQGGPALTTLACAPCTPPSWSLSRPDLSSPAGMSRVMCDGRSGR